MMLMTAPVAPSWSLPGGRGQPGGEMGWGVRWRREEKVRRAPCGWRREDLPRSKRALHPLVSWLHPPDREETVWGSSWAADYHCSAFHSRRSPCMRALDLQLVAGTLGRTEASQRFSQVWPSAGVPLSSWGADRGILLAALSIPVCAKWRIDGTPWCTRRGCWFCSPRSFTPQGQVGWLILGDVYLTLCIKVLTRPLSIYLSISNQCFLSPFLSIYH